MRRRISFFIVTVQAVLFAAHLFLYETLKGFLWPGDSPHPGLQLAMGALSVSFVAASLLITQAGRILRAGCGGVAGRAALPVDGGGGMLGGAWGGVARAYEH